MEKFINRIVLRVKYAHPIHQIIWLASGALVIIACLFVPNRGIETALCIIYSMWGVAILAYSRAGQPYKTCTVITGIFNKKIYWLNQREYCMEFKGCPQQCFISELKEVIHSMPEGATYRMTTHSKIINIITSLDECTQGNISIKQTRGLYKKNLRKIEAMLWNPCCETCRKEKCRIGISKKVKEKDRVVFYGVQIKK